MYSLDDTEKCEIIDSINKVRRNVNPSAANMREVHWSDCYADIAKDYLARCKDIDAYNIDRVTKAAAAGCEASDTVGETIHNADETTVDAIDTWASEKDLYDFEQNVCSDTCFNYAQLVNAETYAVGCAVFNQENCGRTGHTTLCNYGTSVVFTDTPYSAGEACSGCAGEFPSCSEGLCTVAAATTPTVTETNSYTSTPKPSDTRANMAMGILLIISLVAVLISSL
ncbi:GLIPR1-like protein 1 [Oopsacas minuta]|uniref:GLIPR1-like protein 1 n=1 Tax=Oopsacas minuta TaxID=111878 RepID=A0AAV7K7E8_9METZ|nr:GLIPR1-like protein 1 [Oopsacas minuta]